MKYVYKTLTLCNPALTKSTNPFPTPANWKQERKGKWTPVSTLPNNTIKKQYAIYA